MSMARLNNAAGSSAGPSLILPGRNTHYHTNNNNNNSNMGSRPSLPPPNRSSSSAQTVIDLTDSPPPQEGVFNPANRAPSRPAGGPSRGGSSRAEVIDVDALPDSPVLPQRRGGYIGWNPQVADPEAMFERPVAARLLGGLPQMAIRQPHHHHHHHHHHQHGHGWAPRPRPVPVEPSVLYNRLPERNAPFQQQFYQEAEDPILGHGGRVAQAIPELHGVGGPRNGLYGGGGGGGGGAGGGPGRALSMAEDMMQQFIQSIPARHWQEEIFNNFQPPQLDYRQRAPGIIREDSPVDAARARNIDYKAPPPAREGFTRSPKENDHLVCANCSLELGVEGEKPAANEVWAAKCGHVSQSLLRTLYLTSLLAWSDKMNSAIVGHVSTYSARFLLRRQQEVVSRHGRRPRTVLLVAR